MNRMDGLYVAQSIGTARSSARPAGAESEEELGVVAGVVSGGAPAPPALSCFRDARATPPPARRRRLGDGTSDATARIHHIPHKQIHELMKQILLQVF